MTPAALASLAPVPLAEVLAGAALQDRVDRKYLVRTPDAVALLGALAGTHRALEIDGRRQAGYSTVYLDSADLLCHRSHVQGRRRRWKARTRLYVDSGLCRLELKTKGPRGRTVKESLEVGPALHGALDAAGAAFLAEALHRCYGVALPRLAGVLEVSYRRATLVGDGERLTLDTDLEVRLPGGEPVAALAPDAVIVESKAGSAPGAADRALRALGVRECSVSKYVAGTALARPDLPAPALRPVLRRWFVPVRPQVAAEPLVA